MPLLTNEAPKTPWQNVVARKRDAQAKLLAGFSDASITDGATLDLNGTTKDESLTDSPNAKDLAELVTQGKATCSSITNAYIKR